MASRQWDQRNLTIQKRAVTLYAVVAVPTGTTPVLQKYNFPVLGQGGRSLSAATVATTNPLGFPQQYQFGFEGVYSVARTGVGLWTVTLQDPYQRLLGGVSGSMSILSSQVHNITSVQENSDITNLTAFPSASVIGVKLLSATNTPADPTAHATTFIRLQFSLADATEP